MCKYSHELVFNIIINLFCIGNGDGRRPGGTRERTTAPPWSATTSAFTSSNSDQATWSLWPGCWSHKHTHRHTLVIATKRKLFTGDHQASTMISKLGEFNWRIEEICWEGEKVCMQNRASIKKLVNQIGHSNQPWWSFEYVTRKAPKLTETMFTVLSPRWTNEIMCLWSFFQQWSIEAVIWSCENVMCKLWQYFGYCATIYYSVCPKVNAGNVKLY